MDLSAISLGSQSALTALSSSELDEAERSAKHPDEETAKAFESLFARMLVKELRKGLPNGPFGGGAGSDVFEGWFDEHLGDTLVARDGLGLAGMVKASVGRISDTADAQPKPLSTGDSQ